VFPGTISGASGASGAPGTSGASGAPGASGASGASGMSGGISSGAYIYISGADVRSSLGGQVAFYGSGTASGDAIIEKISNNGKCLNYTFDSSGASGGGMFSITGSGVFVSGVDISGFSGKSGYSGANGASGASGAGGGFTPSQVFPYTWNQVVAERIKSNLSGVGTARFCWFPQNFPNNETNYFGSDTLTYSGGSGGPAINANERQIFGMTQYWNKVAASGWGSYVYAPTSSNYSFGTASGGPDYPFSLIVVFYLNNDGISKTIFSKESYFAGAGSGEWWLDIISNQPRLVLDPLNGNYAYNNTASAIATNAWHYLVVTFTPQAFNASGKCSGVCNGMAMWDKSTSLPMTSPVPNNPYYTGMIPGNNIVIVGAGAGVKSGYRGGIAMVALVAETLSATQIGNIYTDTRAYFSGF
jgi:hypothetical protein